MGRRQASRLSGRTPRRSASGVGEQPAGGANFYMRSVFTEHDGRLFVRFVPQYIKASQRHPEAPRLTPLKIEALDAVSALKPEYPGWMLEFQNREPRVPVAK